jgi:putative spermidine/putrescine transport system permease protein
MRLNAQAALWALALPPILLLLALFVVPLGYLFFISFMEPSQAALYEGNFTIANYVNALTDPFYLLIIQRTLIASALVLILCLVLGYPVGAVIASMPPRWRLVMLMVMLFPLMVSNVVRAYGWVTILNRRGIVSTTLQSTGLTNYPMSFLYSMEAVVLGLLTILLPFMVISIANSLSTIDRSYSEAAQSLGAGPVRTFMHVTWPLSSPGVASGLMLVFFLMLSAYVTIALLGGPRFKLLVSLVYDSVIAFNFPRAAALSFILLLIALVLAALVQAVIRPSRVKGG